MTDPDYEPGGSFDQWHGVKYWSKSARKAQRRHEAEERQADYDRRVREEMGKVHLDHDGPEEEIRAEAKRIVDDRQRALWASRKES